MLLFVAFQGLLITMFFLAAGFFLIHATMSGLGNHLAIEHKAVVNGLYVSIYYFSGALGSWLPGYIYDRFGWSSLIQLLALMLVFAAGFILQLRLDTDR
jgi:YNFM family putative membrane transporter